MAQYHFPPVDLLDESKEISVFNDREYVSRLSNDLEQMFAAFKIDVSVYESNGFGYCILFK